MKYVALIIVIIILGVFVGASLRSKKSVAVEPQTPPPMFSVTENPEAKKSVTVPSGETNNKKKTMEKQGVTIEVLKEGAGSEIKSGQTAVVHYTGQFVDGKVFDSSKTRGVPFEFQIGAGMVIKGWDIGVEGMKVGEARKLTIPPELGYGPNGYPPVIPPNAVLVFEVELLGIK